MIHHHPINEEHENKSHESIKAPFDAGYTLFDLSDVYSDGLLGEVFSRTLKEVSGMREQIVIATKCGIREKGDPDKDASHRYDLSKDHITRSCEGSLKRSTLHYPAKNSIA